MQRNPVSIDQSFAGFRRGDAVVSVTNRGRYGRVLGLEDAGHDNRRAIVLWQGESAPTFEPTFELRFATDFDGIRVARENLQSASVVHVGSAR